MRLFIDTNIVLDFLMNRENGKAARDVLKLAEDNLEYECVTASTVTEENIRMAFMLGWDDTEDALQYVVAKANSIDMIITNNVNDYILSDIPVMNAAEFLVRRNIKNQIT